MCGEFFSNQIKSLPVNFFCKSVNIWQSYKQVGGCLVHFVCLATTLGYQKTKKVHYTIHLFAGNYANYSPIYFFCWRTHQ